MSLQSSAIVKLTTAENYSTLNNTINNIKKDNKTLMWLNEYAYKYYALAYVTYNGTYVYFTITIIYIWCANNVLG